MILKSNLFIIFGSSKGLGRALSRHCLEFKENGLLIVNRKSTNQQSENIKEIIIDLSKKINYEQLEKIFAFVDSKYNYQNIYLINNASIIEPIGPIGSVGNQNLVNSAHVNFLNYTIIINEFIKRTSKLKADKKILNITSGAAISAHYGLASYCSTKAALEMFSRCIFIEQQKLKQIKILNLRPGLMDTTMQEKIRTSTKGNFDQVDIYRQILRDKKLLDPKEVAQKIYEILTDNKYWAKPDLNINEVL